MIQLENKCQTLKIVVQRFHTGFLSLNQRGLPRLVVMDDRLISLSDYSHKIFTISQDKSKFAREKGCITKKYFLEALDFDLNIKHEIKHIFINKPTFQKYIEVNETYRKLRKLSIPSGDQWDYLCELLE